MRPLPVIVLTRTEELICLKAATSFIENGDETLDGIRRYNTVLTFHERVCELAETIASEWAMAKWLNLDYDPFLPKMKKLADVGNNIEVKWSKWGGAQLIVHEYDRMSDVAVLVTGQSPNYHIRGWIPVAMAQKTKYRHSAQPNWWVSQPNLQPIENLMRSAHAPLPTTTQRS